MIAMLAIGWLCLCAVSLPPRHPAPAQGGRLLARVAPGRTNSHYKTAAWGDRIRPACREVSHRPILEEASALVTAYRGLLDPAVCGASIDPEGEDEGLTPGCIREEFVPAVKCGSFDIILDHGMSGLFIPPRTLTRRALCSTWVPCVLDADWCLRSDVNPML